MLAICESGLARRVVLAAVLAVVAGGGRPASSASAAGQMPTRRLTIPYLANASRPKDLDFTAAECDVDEEGSTMVCRFRQVFLTVSSIDPAACVITTNGYEQVFRRETPVRWVSRSEPSGDCRAVESTTLEDGGGTHWTMTVRTEPAASPDRSDCRALAADVEIYEWRGVKRALPCTSIQPGAIER